VDAPKYEGDAKLKLRIAARLRQLYVEKGYNSIRHMGLLTGIHHATLARALAGERIGLGVVVRIHRAVNRPLEWFCDVPEPAQQWYDLDSVPALRERLRVTAGATSRASARRSGIRTG